VERTNGVKIQPQTSQIDTDGEACDRGTALLRKSAPSADDRGHSGVTVSSARRLEPVDVTTQPFPGFPTDLQAQLMALLCLADGNSIITEKIFPDRYMHVAELNRMGARLRKEGPTVIVQGVKRLVGAPVMASDLRASAALVLAGLCAKGTTKVNRIYHLERGYDRIDEKLRSVGAEIERRVSDEE
jgi:UDP-N-acetylglucosamine 1-carboxyvinyltransferase